ncbi:hypothetical protein [Nostoc sp.]
MADCRWLIADVIGFLIVKAIAIPGVLCYDSYFFSFAANNSN